MKVKFKLSEKATPPTRGSDGAAGLDLTAISVNFRQEKNGPVWEYETGVSVEIPSGYVGLLFPRSSVTTKTTLALGNSVGVIDEDYRGTIKFQFRNANNFFTNEYKVGDRIGQLVIVPYVKVEPQIVSDLSDTKRGTGGFGSTGN